MNPRVLLFLSLAGLLLTASGLQGAGDAKGAMSPVGAWTISYVDDSDPEGNNTTYQQFDHSGTISGGAWSDSKTNTVGVWKKIAGQRYLSTFWVMIPEGDGYVRVVDEFWMIDKDTMEGRQEGWWIVGMNPLDPPVPPIGPLWTGSQSYKRLTVVPKQVP